jgi:type IV secretory pathway TrbD component
MGGVPRNFAILNATIGAAIGFGLQQPLIGAFRSGRAARRRRLGRRARSMVLDTWPRHMAKPSYFGS